MEQLKKVLDSIHTRYRANGTVPFSIQGGQELAYRAFLLWREIAEGESALKSLLKKRATRESVLAAWMIARYPSSRLFRGQKLLEAVQQIGQ